MSRANRPTKIRILAATIAASLLPLTSCDSAISILGNDTIIFSLGDIEITAQAYEGIVDAAATFDIPLDNFGQLALCESAGNENFVNKYGFAGLFQQGKKFWAKRYAAFTKATGILLPNDILNGRTNAFVSAWMLSQKMKTSNKVTTYLSDWIQCLRGWRGTDNKSKYWPIIKERYDAMLKEKLLSIENSAENKVLNATGTKVEEINNLAAVNFPKSKIVKITSAPAGLAPLELTLI